MTFTTYCPPEEWFNDALDENEMASIEAQEAAYETEPVDG